MYNINGWLKRCEAYDHVLNTGRLCQLKSVSIKLNAYNRYLAWLRYSGLLETRYIMNYLIKNEK